MDGHARIATEAVFGHRDRFGVLVHHQQSTSRAKVFQHAACVPATPERAIQIRSVFGHLQAIQNLRVQHRHMRRRRCDTG